MWLNKRQDPTLLGITVYWKGYRLVKQVIKYVIINYSQSRLLLEPWYPPHSQKSRPQVTLATGLPANSKDGAQRPCAYTHTPITHKAVREGEEPSLPGTNMASIATPSSPFP